MITFQQENNVFDNQNLFGKRLNKNLPNQIKGVQPKIKSQDEVSPSHSLSTNDSLEEENEQELIQQQIAQQKKQQEIFKKTKLCDKFSKSGECPYGPRCMYAHGEEELKQFQNQNPLFKTEICKTHKSGKVCPYGKTCFYAHGDKDLRKKKEAAQVEEKTEKKNKPKKNELCKYFHSGENCPHGVKCRFIHDLADLDEDTLNKLSSKKAADSEKSHSSVGSFTEIADEENSLDCLIENYKWAYEGMMWAFNVKGNKISQQRGFNEFLSSHVNLENYALKPLPVFETIRN